MPKWLIMLKLLKLFNSLKFLVRMVKVSKSVLLANLTLSLPKKKNKKKTDFHILTILAAGKKIRATCASFYKYVVRF